MALNLLFVSPQSCLLARFAPRNGPLLSGLSHVNVASSSRNMIKSAVATDQAAEPFIIRRDANYQPAVFDYDFLLSIESNCTSDNTTNIRRIEQLAEQARRLFKETTEPSAKVEFIGVLQHLGLAYLFESEIRQALEAISNGQSGIQMEEDVNATSLLFRLLRQYGYEVSQDVFNGFMDEAGSFKESLSDDVRGMLSLYEASHLGFVGEATVDEAKAFTTKHLKQMKGALDSHLAKQVQRALELPMHYRLHRSENRWYIEEVYGKEKNMKPFLLELAKLDYNRLQASYQRNVIDVSRWWKELGTMDKLPFIRDRVVECFMFGLGVTFEPKNQYCRDELAKVNQLITMVDDIYDLYGSLDELKLFTDAIQRWDTDAIKNLPEYMKICYMVLFNRINSLAYDTLKEQGVDVIPCLRTLWADLCNAYLVEAKWYHSGYKPTFEEYLNNAWVSISGSVVLAHGYFSLRLKVTPEVLEGVENYNNLLRWPSMLLRLCDDWGTSSHELARGDTLKAVECYMHEAGVSETVAREHVRGMIDETWKKLNKECVGSSPFPRAFVNGAVGLGQASEFMYQFGDGFGRPHDDIKDRIAAIVIEPISLEDQI